LKLLPSQGDIITLKILRKFREALSFTEEELKYFNTRYEYVCQSMNTDESGKTIPCGNKGFFPEPPICAEHDVPMEATGQFNVTITPDMEKTEKEIHMGTQAFTIASNAIKKSNDNKKLTEDMIGLYDKFFPPEKVEEE
jgi:hypothetical protein